MGHHVNNFDTLILLWLNSTLSFPNGEDEEEEDVEKMVEEPPVLVNLPPWEDRYQFSIPATARKSRKKFNNNGRKTIVTGRGTSP